MAKKKGQYKVPFDEKGNQMFWAGSEDYNGYLYGGEWKDNYEFDDELELVSYGRGRSSAFFVLRSKTTGKEFTMFMADMVNYFKGKTLKGKWTFSKKGANFGVRRVEET